MPYRKARIQIIETNEDLPFRDSGAGVRRTPGRHSLPEIHGGKGNRQRRRRQGQQNLSSPIGHAVVSSKVETLYVALRLYRSAGRRGIRGANWDSVSKEREIYFVFVAFLAISPTSPNTRTLNYPM